jgi:hypothetical protein
MKYNVTIVREEHREHTFQVEADTEDAAYDIAMDEVANYDFGNSPIKWADENVTSITKE